MDSRYNQKILAIRKYIGERVLISEGKENFADIAKPILQVDVDLDSKFIILDFKRLLSNNGKNNKTLFSLCEFLEKIEIICGDIKKHTFQWKFIPVTHPIYQKMLEVKGGKELFQLIGYTDANHGGLQISESTIPESQKLNDLLVDIIVARCELTEYLLNSHPNPLHIFNAFKSESADSDLSCSICGVQQSIVICELCSSKNLCEKCDAAWHSHPKRVVHERIKRLKPGGQSNYISSSNPVENCQISSSITDSKKQHSYISEQELRDASEMSIPNLRLVLLDLSNGIKFTEKREQKQNLKRKWNAFLSVLNKKIDDKMLELAEHIKTVERHIQLLVMQDSDFYRRESYSQLNEDKMHAQKKLAEMRTLQDHCSTEINPEEFLINYPLISDVFPNEKKDYATMSLFGSAYNSDNNLYAKNSPKNHNSPTSMPDFLEKTTKSQVLILDDVAPPPDLEYKNTFLRQCIDKEFPILSHLTSKSEPYQSYFDMVERKRSHTLSDISRPQGTRALSPLLGSQNMLCRQRKASREDGSLVWPSTRETESGENVHSEQQWKNKEAQVFHEKRLLMDPVRIAKESSVDPSYEEVLLNQAAAPMSPGHRLSKSLDSSAVQNLYSPGKEAKKMSVTEEMKQLNEKKIIIEMQTKAGEVVRNLRLAEKHGYDADVMLVALEKHQHDGMDPLYWIEKKWPDYISTVIARAANHNIHGLLEDDVVYALKNHRGNIDKALDTAIKLHRKRMEEIKSFGEFPEEEIVQALLRHNGNIDPILDDLYAPRLAEFQQRIWDETADEESNDYSLPPQLVDLLLNKDIEPERRVRAAFAEISFKGWKRAEYVIKILDNHLENVDNCEVTDVIDVVQNSNNFENAVEQLTIVCNLCLNQYPQGKIMTLSFCNCKFCQECFLQNFKIKIREEPVRRWTCPTCSLPELNDEETITNYFAFLNLQLKQVIDEDTFNLYETKLRDWHLHKDPNFRWCPSCENGFLYHADGLKMNCPHCHRATCFKCMKPWQDQHQRLSCKKFNEWLTANDPNNQAFGLKLILKKNGIVCPECLTPYFLAKGGCIHFTCKNCQHEFCAGCQKTFYQKEKCHKFNDCPTKGIHAHHPRDCLYYLRDEDVKTLQKLLKSKNVHYDTQPQTTQENPHHCFIMVQKEINGNTLKDEKCGSFVADGHAGLCLIHYKEYLVSLINQNKLDPVPIFSTDNLKQILSRNDRNIPEKVRGMSDKEYRRNLEELVKQTEQLAFGD